ncbi:helix-turn-helix domain-containing protein [Candidatus Latescibacterota bacterium]
MTGVRLSDNISELIERAQVGDMKAFREIIDRHSQYIYSTAYRLWVMSRTHGISHRRCASGFTLCLISMTNQSCLPPGSTV